MLHSFTKGPIVRSKSPFESFEYSSAFFTIVYVVSLTAIGCIPELAFTSSNSVPSSLMLTNDSISATLLKALSKIDSSVLYKIFSISYVDKTEEIKKSSEYINAVAEYEKFMMYMSKVNDIKKINEYIEKNYPEVSSFDNNDINKSFSTPVEQLNLSNRLTNALKKNGKLTLNDIYNTTAAEYRSFSNFGKKCCLELAEVLSNRTDTHPNRVTLSRDLFTISTLNGE